MIFSVLYGRSNIFVAPIIRKIMTAINNWIWYVKIPRWEFPLVIYTLALMHHVCLLVVSANTEECTWEAHIKMIYKSARWGIHKNMCVLWAPSKSLPAVIWTTGGKGGDANSIHLKAEQTSHLWTVCVTRSIGRALPDFIMWPVHFSHLSYLDLTIRSWLFSLVRATCIFFQPLCLRTRTVFMIYSQEPVVGEGS